MAENQQVSAFPLPPKQYVDLYTDENVKRNRVPAPPPIIQDTDTMFGNTFTADDEIIRSLEVQGIRRQLNDSWNHLASGSILCFIIPLDTYTMFGNTFTADDQIIRSLEVQGFRRLYPQNYDHKRELKKLNHSILANFLDLLDILIKAPDSAKRNEKLEDLNLIFIHMHHLINEFRPHQARETLRVMMELQKKQRQEISERFQTHLDKVTELLQKSLSSLPDDFSLDSKALVKSEILLSNFDEPEVSVKTEPCDQLDRMMCDIVDSMN